MLNDTQHVHRLHTQANRATRPRSRWGWWWLALRILISVILLTLLLVKANLHAFIGTLVHIDLTLASIGLAFGVIALILSSWQWQIVLKQEQIKLRLHLLVGLYFVGHAFGQFLPTSIGGDVPMAAYVARFSKRGVGAASATLMTRVIGLLGLLITAIPVSVAASWLVPGLGWSLTLFLLTAAVSYVGGLAALLHSPWLLRLVGIRRTSKRRISRKVLELAETISQYRKRQAAAARVLLVSFIFYICSNLNFYCYGQALHLHSPFWFYCIAIPVTTLATMLPISLNGYGIRGASFALVFALMGETTAASLSLAVVMESQRLIFSLVGAVLVPVLNWWSRRQADSPQPLATNHHRSRNLLVPPQEE